MKTRVIAGVMSLFAALGAPALASAAAPPACPTAKARYQLMDAPGFTAGFLAQPSHEGWLTDVAFFVRSAPSGKTYWFLFDRGSARYINMISTTDVTAPGWTPPDADGGPRP